MILQKAGSIIFMMMGVIVIICDNPISKIADTFGYFFFRHFFLGIEDHIAGGIVHPDILHTLFLEVLMNIDRTGRTVHPFHFPLDLFHTANLSNHFAASFYIQQYLGNKVAIPVIFASWSQVFPWSKS